MAYIILCVDSFSPHNDFEIHSSIICMFFLITEYVEIRLHPIEHQNEWESYFLAIFVIGI